MCVTPDDSLYGCRVANEVTKSQHTSHTHGVCVDSMDSEAGDVGVIEWEGVNWVQLKFMIFILIRRCTLSKAYEPINVSS